MPYTGTLNNLFTHSFFVALPEARCCRALQHLQSGSFLYALFASSVVLIVSSCFRILSLRNLLYYSWICEHHSCAVPSFEGTCHASNTPEISYLVFKRIENSYCQAAFGSPMIRGFERTRRAFQYHRNEFLRPWLRTQFKQPGFTMFPLLKFYYIQYSDNKRCARRRRIFLGFCYQ